VLVLYIDNISDADYILDNQSEYLLHTHAKVFTLKAHSITRLEVRTIKMLDQVEMKFKVLNAFTTPTAHPVLELSIEIPKN